MNLADYQEKIVDDIYNVLVNDDNNIVISLFGCTGCGKTTIAKGLSDKLKEDWSILFISGITPNLSPYLTWHVGTHIYEKKKLDLGAELTFGIDFIPIPITLGLNGNISAEKENYILTPSEVAILSGIRKQVSSNSNILIVADNYDLWDIPSKQFLEKLVLPELNLLKHVRLAALILSEKGVTLHAKIVQINIPIENISNEDLLFILRQNGFSQRINLKDIRVCSGDDLFLACMAAKYYKNGENTKHEAINFNELMDKRCRMLPEAEQKACQVLQPLSIIDSYFTRQETAFFLDSLQITEEEKNYIAEEYLEIAEEHAFISGEENYYFSNEKIRKYFKSLIAKKERFHHKKFANYLQTYHPEDYYNRGKHLSFSLLKNEFKSVIESWQLLFLAYIRRASEVGDFSDIYHILDDINNLIHQLKPESETAQLETLKALINGYKSFAKYDYKKTMIYLQTIMPSRLCNACLAESQRILLLCQIQLADNSIAMLRLADDLYETINAPDFQEDEQYCRAALVLFDAYIDKSNVQEKNKVIKRRFIQIIQSHTGSLVFEEFEAAYNRKAALYFAAIIAKRQTQQSILFYREHYNKNGLYMALCNHSGNSIVSDDYIAAREALSECENMVLSDNNWYYPSYYKIENNKLLLSFLEKEKMALITHANISTIAKESAKEFLSIIGDQKDEVSHVIYLNYLSLLMLSGSERIHTEMLKAFTELTEIDEYYQYYLHDLKFAYEVIYNQNHKKAKEELILLVNLDVPLLHEYRKIFLKRQNVQKKIIEKELCVGKDPVKYHHILLDECSHIQDPSCRFYGRGFLLSDLQFLSF